MASKKRSRKHRHRSRKMRGGYKFSPASLNDSYMIKDVVPQEFTPQDRALVGGRRMKRGGISGGSMKKAMNKSMKRSMNKSMGMGMMGGRFRKRKGGLGESGASAASAV